MAFADFFSPNSFKAFWSNYERMEGYITLLHLGAYFLVMSAVLRTQDAWNRLFATSLSASLIMAIYSFFQLAGRITINQGGVRVDGTLGNASYLGIYMVFHIFIAALLFFRFQKMWQKVLVSIVALLDLIILYHTATRGAILGLLGGALVAFIFLALKSEKGDKIRKFALVSFVAIIVFVGLFIALKNTSFVTKSPVLSRFSTLSFSEIKTQGRYFVWPMAIKGFVERPILGWGQEGFNFVFNKYYDPRMYNQEPWFDRAHNTYLDWLIAGGLLGFLCYISIIFFLLYYILKAKDNFLNKQDKAVLLGVLSAYLFHNLFVFDQISSYILFFTVLAYVHAHTPEATMSLWDKIALKLKGLFEREHHRPVVEAIVLILLVIILYFANYVPWQQNKNLLEILRIGSQNQVATLDVYKEPFSQYGMWFAESLEHVSEASIAVAANQSASPELKQGLFDTVDKAFTKQIEKIPGDARYRLFYGLYLSRFGWYGRALEQLKIARDLSPNKQQIYFELVNNFLADGKPADALNAAKTAYELEPSNQEAKSVYGLTATAVGDNALADKILSDEESKIVFDDRYLGVLLSTKQYQKIIDIVKKRIALDPTNPQHMITLTAAYLEAGRRQDAIGVLEEMIKLDPSFKEKGTYYINEIRAGRNP
jgi:O-antigen ligase/tetratricopeptide (TPR) repeat protein